MNSHRSVRDRTAEFFQLADRLKSDPSLNAQPRVPSYSSISEVGESSSGTAHRGEFTRQQAQIGLGIQKTAAKLQRLTKLVKQTSLFDDPAAEINELTALVKQDIQKLNDALLSLQQISDGNKKPSQHSNEHNTTVVDTLRSRLKNTTSSFRGILEQRKDALQKHQTRKQMFAGGTTNDGPSSSMGLLEGQQQSDGDQMPSFMLSDEQQQSQLQVPQVNMHLQSRAEAVQNVEQTIQELGGIFQQLAVMVQEQGDLAVRIDDNITDTLSNVTNAQAQLLKYLNAISSNRWLLMQVFAVLLVVMLVFVLFIA